VFRGEVDDIIAVVQKTVLSDANAAIWMPVTGDCRLMMDHDEVLVLVPTEVTD
jgi:hypothetical protein